MLAKWSSQFLRQMINLLHAVHHPLNSKVPIRLSAGFRADLAWWQEFLVHWNGVFSLCPLSLLPSIELTTDASGSWGRGAWHRHNWFQVECDLQSQARSLSLLFLSKVPWANPDWGSHHGSYGRGRGFDDPDAREMAQLQYIHTPKERLAALSVNLAGGRMREPPSQ